MRIDGFVLIQLNAMHQLNFEIAFIKPLESNNQAAAAVAVVAAVARGAAHRCRCSGRHNGKGACRREEPFTLNAAADVS